MYVRQWDAKVGEWAEPLPSFQLWHTSNEWSPFHCFSYDTPQMSGAPSIASADTPQMSRAPSIVSATTHLKWAEPLPLFQLRHTSDEWSPFHCFSYDTPQMSRAPSIVSATSHLILQPFPSIASPMSPGKLPMYWLLFFNLKKGYFLVSIHLGETGTANDQIAGGHKVSGTTLDHCDMH